MSPCTSVEVVRTTNGVSCEHLTARPKSRQNSPRKRCRGFCNVMAASSRTREKKKTGTEAQGGKMTISGFCRPAPNHKAKNKKTGAPVRSMTRRGKCGTVPAVVGWTHARHKVRLRLQLVGQQPRGACCGS